MENTRQAKFIEPAPTNLTTCSRHHATCCCLIPFAHCCRCATVWPDYLLVIPTRDDRCCVGEKWPPPIDDHQREMTTTIGQNRLVARTINSAPGGQLPVSGGRGWVWWMRAAPNCALNKCARHKTKSMITNDYDDETTLWTALNRFIRTRWLIHAHRFNTSMYDVESLQNIAENGRRPLLLLRLI